MLENLRERFPENGAFDLPLGENVTKYARINKVPNEPGIYLIYSGYGCKDVPIYVGKAGTFTQKEGFKAQGIAKRLGAKQEQMPRNKFFKNLMSQRRYEKGLSFAWFVTYGRSKMILPALAEAEVIQEYFNKHKFLPVLNKAI